MLTKIKLWFESLKAKFLLWKDRNKKHFVCSECGREISKEEPKSAIYDFNGFLEYICEDCEKLHDKLMKERDEFFQKGCPLHNKCALWCGLCEREDKCEFVEKYDEYIRSKGLYE